MDVLNGALVETRPVTTPTEIRSQRRLLLIAGTTYLVWWFAVEGILPGSYNPLAGRLIVVAFFFLALAVSFVRGVAHRSLEGPLTAGVWLLTAHYFYLVHRNPGAMPWAIGAYVVVIAAGACLRGRGAQLAYSALCLVLALLVAMRDPILLRSIFLPGLATMLILSNVTLHTRFLLEKERAERLLADARIAAAEANVAARDEFIAIASHELYTPLTALQLTIQSVSNRVGHGASASEDAYVVERLDRCQRHVKRLNRLVDELLDASRIGSGTLGLRLESVNLVELVHDVANLFAEKPGRDPVDVVVPSTASIMRCDRIRIEQVVTNLVRNALTFGAGKPVRVVLEPASGGMRLSVVDHGIGIAPEDQTRIFDRFERAVSTKNYGGMGLGLFVARQIVEAHRGTIRVESALGKGATFIVDLPIDGPKADDA